MKMLRSRSRIAAFAAAACAALGAVVAPTASAGEVTVAVSGADVLIEGTGDFAVEAEQAGPGIVRYRPGSFVSVRVMENPGEWGSHEIEWTTLVAGAGCSWNNTLGGIECPVSGVQRVRSTTAGAFVGFDASESQVPLDVDLRNADSTTIHGSSAADTIRTGAGHDEVFGHAGNDLIETASGQDLITPGPGNDTVNAGDEGDTVSSDPGPDGDDAIDLGGDRGDVISYESRTTPVKLSGWPLVGGGVGEHDRIVGASIVYGSRSAGSEIDATAAGAAITRIQGGTGADIITAGAGGQNIYGGSGADLLTGGAGRDLFSVGTGGTVFAQDGEPDLISCFLGLGSPTVYADPIDSEGYPTDALSGCADTATVIFDAPPAPSGHGDSDSPSGNDAPIAPEVPSTPVDAVPAPPAISLVPHAPATPGGPVAPNGPPVAANAVKRCRKITTTRRGPKIPGLRVTLSRTGTLTVRARSGTKLRLGKKNLKLRKGRASAKVTKTVTLTATRTVRAKARNGRRGKTVTSTTRVKLRVSC